jgi:hypothetical protein
MLYVLSLNLCYYLSLFILDLEESNDNSAKIKLYVLITNKT